jgi:hypothetical protein
MNKRHRGRSRRPNNNNSNNNPNRSLDSNGPDIKVRGSAKTIYDKYITLARDATSAGLRVKAENYLQHAEHYLRVVLETQAKVEAAAELKQARMNAEKNTDDGNDAQKDKSSRRTRRPPYKNGQSQNEPARSEGESTAKTEGDKKPTSETEENVEKDEVSEAAAETKPKTRTRRKKAVKPKEDKASDVPPVEDEAKEEVAATE